MAKSGGILILSESALLTKLVVEQADLVGLPSFGAALVDTRKGTSCRTVLSKSETLADAPSVIILAIHRSHAPDQLCAIFQARRTIPTIVLAVPRANTLARCKETNGLSSSPDFPPNGPLTAVELGTAFGWRGYIAIDEAIEAALFYAIGIGVPHQNVLAVADTPHEASFLESAMDRAGLLSVRSATLRTKGRSDRSRGQTLRRSASKRLATDIAVHTSPDVGSRSSPGPQIYLSTATRHLSASSAQITAAGLKTLASVLGTEPRLPARKGSSVDQTLSRYPMDFADLQHILAALGISCLPEYCVRSASAASERAAEVGLPVSLRVSAYSSARILDKAPSAPTRELIREPLSTFSGVRQAFSDLVYACKSLPPNIHIAGITVQKAVRRYPHLRAAFCFSGDVPLLRLVVYGPHGPLCASVTEICPLNPAHARRLATMLFAASSPLIGCGTPDEKKALATFIRALSQIGIADPPVIGRLSLHAASLPFGAEPPWVMHASAVGIGDNRIDQHP